MNSLAIVTIAVGALIILTRGPLVLAPKGTLEVFRKVIETPARIRILGVFVALLGLSMISVAWGIDQTVAQVILVFGWFLSLLSVFLLLLFPSLYRGLAAFVLDILDDGAVARAAGAIGVGFGVLLLYLGVSVL